MCTVLQVTTVDRYQGQQNDYIILSLVRTKHVGHLRDVRRLVVAMSRARLGLYVLARVGLFHGCTELQPAFTLVGVMEIFSQFTGKSRVFILTKTISQKKNFGGYFTVLL